MGDDLFQFRMTALHIPSVVCRVRCQEVQVEGEVEIALNRQVVGERHAVLGPIPRATNLPFFTQEPDSFIIADSAAARRQSTFSSPVSCRIRWGTFSSAHARRHQLFRQSQAIPSSAVGATATIRLTPDLSRTN